MRSDKPYHCIVCSAKFSREDVKLYNFFVRRRRVSIVMQKVRKRIIELGALENGTSLTSRSI